MEKVKVLGRKYLEKQRIFGLDEDANVGNAFYEIASLLWFYDIANRQGLRVPDIPQAGRGNEFLEVQKQSSGLSGLDFLDGWSAIAAIAQHYGIPTRMLDWSFELELALFFAVMGLSETPEQSKNTLPRSVSLWILDKSKVAILTDEIRFVVPKYCDNPNIHAQSGLFTLLVGDDPGRDLKVVVEEAFRKSSTETQSTLSTDGIPILQEVIIPYDDALKLKKNLKDRGMNYDSAFPGWHGIARSMEIQSGIR